MIVVPLLTIKKTNIVMMQRSARSVLKDRITSTTVPDQFPQIAAVLETAQGQSIHQIYCFQHHH